MHGKEGEEGTLYRFLKASRKPFVGSSPKGARIAFDKIIFKQYCEKKGIVTAEWNSIKTTHDITTFGFPCVLKAAFGGSSHEIALLHSKKDVTSTRVKKILKSSDNKFFVEGLLHGVEITVGVLFNKSLPVIEIVPPKSGWFDYKNKYSGESYEIPFAPSVKQAVQKYAQKIALRIHQDLKLGSYSRTDFIVVNNTPYILEINTPGGVGLTPVSLFPKAALAVGISFKELVKQLVKNI